MVDVRWLGRVRFKNNVKAERFSRESNKIYDDTSGF